MKTYSATPKDIERAWHLIDAEGVVLGRLAALVANRLRGKHKPRTRPMWIAATTSSWSMPRRWLTGNKLSQKTTIGIPAIPAASRNARIGQILSGAYPERVIEKAVERMVPRARSAGKQIRKLKIYRRA